MLDTIIKIVKEAGKIFKTSKFDVFEKGSKSNLVTTCDLMVQDYLYKEFKKHFPNFKFYGEEKNLKESYLDDDFVFVVDPIDGTCNFAHNLNLSVISIGVLHQKEIILGVVYNPYLDELFYAEKNKGAFLNNQRIEVSKRSFAESLYCTSFSSYDKTISKYCFDILQDVFYEVSDARRIGTCALELCYLACGRIDLYFEISLQPYDYAGASLIVKEAGGIITNLDDSINYEGRNPIIASNNKENYLKLKKIINKHLMKNPY